MDNQESSNFSKPVSSDLQITPVINRWQYQRCAKQVLTDIKRLATDPYIQSYFHYESSGEEDEPYIFRLDGYLLPRTNPYKHGSIKVCIRFYPDHPFKTPEVQLLTYIYHPAVNNNVSRPVFCRECCCLRSLTIYTISALLNHLVCIIDNPDFLPVPCKWNSEARYLYNSNKVEYERKVLATMKKYACPRPNQSIISLKFTAKQIIRRQLEFNSTKINQLPLSSNLKQYLNSPLALDAKSRHT